MKKRILWLVLLAAAVVTASLAITSPLVQNLLYTGRRTGGSDRVTGTYELQGEDLTLKEPVFGAALKEPRTVMLTGRIDQQGGEISIDLANGKTRTVVPRVFPAGGAAAGGQHLPGSGVQAVYGIHPAGEPRSGTPRRMTDAGKAV